MKRIQLEPWTPYDKLSLASAVLRTGDQNWNAVARATRNIFEENTKYLIEEKRSPDWFSNKQCAAQYEALLKNIGPRRKKKTDKTGNEHTGDSPNDIIISAVRQECIEELKRSMATTQAMYLKLHKEYEDIQAGKMDHKLEEILEEYEAKEREKEIKMKLKFKIGEKNSEIIENNVTVKAEDNETKKQSEKEQPVSEPAKTNITTSPLLTSLLQSPSPLTRPSLPANTSPTISLLLNSSPSVPSSDSPTLSKLLEASNSVIGSPVISTNNTSGTPQASLKTDAISSIPPAPIISLPSQQQSTVVPTQAASLISTASLIQQSSASSPVPSNVQSVPTTLPAIIDQPALSPSTADSVPTPSTPITSSVTCTASSTTNTSSSSTTSAVLSPKTLTIPTVTVTAPTPSDKTQISSPSTLEESKQETVDTILKNVDTVSCIPKIAEESKENLETAEVVNRSTPEIVLEDLVDSVVESEVVIDQETPHKKKDIIARKLQVELDEAEPEEEVMETVEEMIEKVEEAIIETVGEGSTEIDLVLNQSSETDNLSDNIEALELDSHAVKLIVLGHDQASRINIRHDTEVANDPDKASRTKDDSIEKDETDDLGVVKNSGEEEFVTNKVVELKNQEVPVKEIVDNVLEEEEVVEESEIDKNEKPSVKEEEIEEVENKSVGSAAGKSPSETSVITEDIIDVDAAVTNLVKKNNDTVATEIVAAVKVEENSGEDGEEIVEEVEIKSGVSPVKSPSGTSVKENIVDIDPLATDVDQKKENVIPGESIVFVKTEADEEEIEQQVELEDQNGNVGVELEMKEENLEEEAIVEETPEEVVIAELLEEVLQAEKIMKESEDDQNSKEHEIVSVEHISIKQDLNDDDESSIPMASEDPLKISDHEDSNFKKTDDEASPIVKEEQIVGIELEKDDLTLVSVSSEKEATQKEESTESKTAVRKSKILEENLASPSNVESMKALKQEKDDDSGRNTESKSTIQEMEKRRPGRKRYQQLAGYGDSKPNSPAPSSHSMEDDKEYKAWKKSIMLVYNRLAAHKYASVFLKPITEADATGYRSVVLKPMDLTTIKRNIETGVIRSTVEFQRDMILMAQNAMIYNKVDSLVFKMAEDMLADMMSQMEVMVQALGDGVPLWGDSEEKLNTRGRASKLQLDEAGNAKRRSHLDDTPYRRRNQQQQQQAEDSAKKRRLNDDVMSKRRSEDSSSKRKSITEDISKRKSTEDVNSSRKKQLTLDDSFTPKKKLDEQSSSSSVKKKVTDDSSSSAKKKTEETVTKKGGTAEDTPVSSGKRRVQQQIESRKSDSGVYKRKSMVDENSSSGRRKNTPVDDTPPTTKRKSNVEETPTNKRKRSSMAAAEEPRSSVKRKRADAT